MRNQVQNRMGKSKCIRICMLIGLVVLLLSGKEMVRAAQTKSTIESVTASTTENVTANTTEAAVKYPKPGTTKVDGQFGKKKIKLTWDKVKKADVYYVYKMDSKGKFKQIASTNKLTYSDKDVKRGNYYTYKVVAAYEVDGQFVKGKSSKACKVLADTVDPSKKMVAITFDDGPGPYTKEIVKCLKKNESRATFFVLGQSVDSYKSSVKAAYKIGCEIGNHSYSHSNLPSLSQGDIKSQMQKTDQKVKAITGKSTTVMRTPYGATSANVKNAVGKPIILWSIDTLDWKTRNKSKTISAVMDNVKDGDVILMHDIHEPTKEAALTIIPRLRRQGYQLVTVSELAKYRGYKMQNGSVYHNFYKK